MEYIDNYDEVHVISDLHLGGASGFRIFTAADELTALVAHVAKRPPARHVALVINGDFIDFLAEEGAQHFNPHKAVRMLQRIVSDPAFKPVVDALKAFIATKRRTLVITLGNHDLELALPWVQEWIVNELAAGQEHHRARIRFAMNKGGYLCRVGGSKVLCVHGNEDDAFNTVDHKKLADVTADLVQGRTPDDWIPNAGSRMVIELVNELMEKHPFINLFKPEFKGAVVSLLFVDPGHLNKLGRGLSILTDMGIDALRLKTGFLGEGADGGAEGARKRPPMDADALMQNVERAYRNESAREKMLVGGEGDAEYLGVIGALWKKIRGEDDGAVLQEALESLLTDRSFEWSFPDETFSRFDAKVDPKIPFIVAGHTHHCRALPRRRGRGFYFNSGTWAHLMQITPATLKDSGKLAQLGKLLREGTLDDLEKHGFLLKERNVVSIVAEQGKTTGTLYQVALKDNALGLEEKKSFAEQGV